MSNMLTVIGKRIGTDTNWKQNSTEFIADDIDTIEINGIRITVARLRELAEAEREELIYILPDCKTCANKEDNRTCAICVGKTIDYQNSFYEPIAAADAGKGTDHANAD